MAGPSDAQVEAFLNKLRAFRDTLPEDEQRLLNAMYYAAIGKQEKADEDVESYWVAYHNPVGPVGGPGHGTAVATPWGAAYGSYYPRYYW